MAGSRAHSRAKDGVPSLAYGRGPAMTAELAILLEPLDIAGEGWALARGERWRVRCDAPLPAGAMVRVVRREGLLLWVEPA